MPRISPSTSHRFLYSRQAAVGRCCCLRWNGLLVKKEVFAFVCILLLFVWKRLLYHPSYGFAAITQSTPRRYNCARPSYRQLTHHERPQTEKGFLRRDQRTTDRPIVPIPHRKKRLCLSPPFIDRERSLGSPNNAFCCLVTSTLFSLITVLGVLVTVNWLYFVAATATIFISLLHHHQINNNNNTSIAQ